MSPLLLLSLNDLKSMVRKQETRIYNLESSTMLQDFENRNLFSQIECARSLIDEACHDIHKFLAKEAKAKTIDESKSESESESESETQNKNDIQPPPYC